MNRLPATVDDLRGLRAARWIRESTTGQFDRYGPEAQAELQNAAIERLGLADTGLEWRIAHSGRTVYRSPAMAAMLDAAATGAFDVLLVGYVSRWQRNLRQTLNLLEDVLHPAGVAVWFADEQILSSCERDWDQLVAEATDAERYSRRLSRRYARATLPSWPNSATQAAGHRSASAVTIGSSSNLCQRNSTPSARCSN